MICGLPSSGKSTFWEPFAKILDYHFIDDFDLYVKNGNLRLEDFFYYLNKYDYIITEPLAVTKEWRNGLLLNVGKYAPQTEIFWIFYANEPEVCLKNALSRENKEVAGYIKYLSKNYSIEPNSLILPCYRN
jgi:hypothetical protein